MSIELAAFILGTVLFLGLVFYISSTSQSEAKQLDRDFFKHKWDEIERSLNQRGSSVRQAVADADKLLDHALKQLGYGGDTMAERIKSAENRFRDKEAVWQAHKLRNRVVHEADFNMVGNQAKKAVDKFRKALEDLGAM